MLIGCVASRHLRAVGKSFGLLQHLLVNVDRVEIHNHDTLNVPAEKGASVGKMPCGQPCVRRKRERHEAQLRTSES